MAVNWEGAQHQELAIWQRTVGNAADVLSEIEEAAHLEWFGRNNGVRDVCNSIELGVGPMGIGWAAFGVFSERAVGVDPLPQLKIDTGHTLVDEFAQGLQRRIEYMQGDATKRLPFKDAQFDLVVCDNVIDHTQDPLEVLVEARRLCSHGGRLLFGVNVFSALGLLKWRQVTRRFTPTAENVVCHPHSFREEDLPTLLARAGWRVVAMKQAGMRQRAAGRAYRARLVAQ